MPESFPGKLKNLDLTPCQLLKNQGTHTKPILTMEEHRALTQLREDTSRVVLTVDKTVAMVIMDKQDYTNKALYELLCFLTNRTIFS